MRSAYEFCTIPQLPQHFYVNRGDIHLFLIGDPGVAKSIGKNEKVMYITKNQQGYKSIIEGKPTTPRNKTYDKIIVSKEWKISNSKIIKGKADHYLCFADVELK